MSEATERAEEEQRKQAEHESWVQTTRRKMQDLVSGPPEHIIEWMTDVEARLKDHDKAHRRVGAFKDEVKADLSKINEIEGRIEAQFNGLGDIVGKALNDLAQRITVVHQGSVTAEARVHGVWNSFNAAVQMIVEVFTGDHPLKARLMEVAGEPGKTIKFTETKDTINEWLKEAGRRLWKEAHDHHQTELNRIKAEQRAGKKPTPMRAQAPSAAMQLMQDTAKHMTEHRDSITKQIGEMSDEERAAVAGASGGDGAEEPEPDAAG